MVAFTLSIYTLLIALSTKKGECQNWHSPKTLVQNYIECIAQFSKRLAHLIRHLVLNCAHSLGQTRGDRHNRLVRRDWRSSGRGRCRPCLGFNAALLRRNPAESGKRRLLFQP